MRERETMHITESKVSEKPTEMIVSNRADSTFSCGLSFNGAGETGDSWLAFFIYLFIYLMSEIFILEYSFIKVMFLKCIIRGH